MHLSQRNTARRLDSVHPRGIALSAITPRTIACTTGAVLLILSAAVLCADEKQADPTLLTLDRIFQGNEWNSQPVPSYRWSNLRRGGYTTLDKPPGDQAGRDLVWHDPASGQSMILVPAHHFIPPGEESPLAIEGYQFSDDESKLLLYTHSRRVWRTRSRGNYWVLDVASGELKRVAGDAAPSTLMFAKFSPDGSRIAYVRERNIYVQDLRDSRISALTSDASGTRINGTFDWVYEEELGLRDGFRWSPDGQSIAYWQIDVEGVREFLLVNYTDGLYPTVQSIPYPKAGEKNPAARVGVVSAAGGETRWLSVPGDPREHYLTQMDWAGDAERIVLQQFNRLQNTNRLMLASASSGQVQTLFTESDAAWVENSNATLQWLGSHKQLVWLSERDGWQHAYLASLADRQMSLITAGPYDITDIAGIDETGGWLYFLASPDNPSQRYLYRVRLDGTNLERVTPAEQSGTHVYDVSPDAKWAVHTYSSFVIPPITELISLPEHKTVKVLVDNLDLKQKVAKLKPARAEFFRIEIGDGVRLDAWCLHPPEMDSQKKHPAVFYVYGEPAGQTVLDRWGGKRFLWHWMLAQQGYVVLSVDNRGTPAPRGRDWRKSIYRQIGILASADQAAATRAILAARPYIDADRLAIWGWSGGGSMSLNAILRYPDLYQAAMAVAPVPNLRFYDTIYQERYMGLPGENADGYRLGSPISYASQLAGDLLLVHGTGDDNCHYQGTEALINELVAHDKHFSMLAYPGRSHGISERKNTTRHLHGLLTRFLQEKIPPGAR